MTYKEHADNFLDTFIDQYDPEMYQDMSEAEAENFVTDHLDEMVAINGTSDLWYVELNAIKELNLYDRYDIPKEDVKARLEAYV